MSSDIEMVQRIAELEQELAAARAALEPFAKVARGIPDNWPEQCRLRIDNEADTKTNPREWLCYHGIVESEGGVLPTIYEWRQAARAAGGAE